jgi:hypothetical protein
VGALLDWLGRIGRIVLVVSTKGKSGRGEGAIHIAYEVERGWECQI